MRRKQVPARLHWLVLGIEVFVFLLGTAVTVAGMHAGKPLSRPGTIAFVAGVVGMAASLFAAFAAPRIRARRGARVTSPASWGE